MRKILGHGMKCSGLGIPEPWKLAVRCYSMLLDRNGEVVVYLIVSSNLNYIGHREFMWKLILTARK